MKFLVFLVVLAVPLLIWMLRQSEPHASGTTIETNDASAPTPRRPNPMLQGLPASGAPQNDVTTREVAVEGENAPVPTVDAETLDWTINILEAVAADGTLLETVHLEFVDESGKSDFTTITQSIQAVNTATGERFVVPPWPTTLNARGSGRVVAVSEGCPTWMSPQLDRPATGKMDLRIEFEAGRVVAGVVMCQDGTTPAEQCLVTAYELDGGDKKLPGNEMLTDEKGRFEFLGMPPEPVVVVAQTDPRFHGNRERAGGPVEAPHSLDDGAMRISLSRRRIIRFRIVDIASHFKGKDSRFYVGVQGEKKPRNPTEASASPQIRELAALFTDTSDTTDPISLDPSEVFFVSAHAPGFDPSSKVLVDGSKGPIEETIDLRITEAPGSAMSIVLILETPSEHAPKAIPVTIRSTSKTYTTYFRVNDGRAKIPYVMPDTQGISIFHDMNSSPHRPDELWFPMSKSLVLDAQLKPGETCELTFRLRPGAAVNITGPDGSKGLISSAKFRLKKVGSVPTTHLWAREGSQQGRQFVSAVLEPGTYVVSDDALGGRWKMEVELVAGSSLRVVAPAQFVKRE